MGDKSATLSVQSAHNVRSTSSVPLLGASMYKRPLYQERHSLRLWRESQNYCRRNDRLRLFIIEGLKKYQTGHENVEQRANFLTTRTIQTIRENGFWEYFDPTDDGTQDNAKGIGFSSFSWTAAILIQLLKLTKINR
jgi:hypothetical protein